MDLGGNGLHQSEDVFQQEVAFWNHSQNICARVGIACKECHDRARAALWARDWAAAKAEWERCLNLVRPSSLWAADWVSYHWLLCWVNLLLANLLGFCFKEFGDAFRFAAQSYALLCYQMPGALDLRRHVWDNYRNLIYLWASEPDCEEMALDPTWVTVVNNTLEAIILLQGKPRVSVFDSEVKKLKHLWKEFAITGNEYFLCWSIQEQYLYYGYMEEILRWAREGNKLYQKKYPGMLDYISKMNEATALTFLMAWEEAKKVLEAISNELDAEPGDHPAALDRRTPKYSNLIHSMLELCNNAMSAKSYEGKVEERNQTMNRVKECQRIKLDCEGLEQSELERKCDKTAIEELQAQALEHAQNNKLEEAESCFEKCSKLGVRVSAVTESYKKLAEHFQDKYRKCYESGSLDESDFLNAELWTTKYQENTHDFRFAIGNCESLNMMDLVKLYHEKDRKVMFLKQSSNIGLPVDEYETAPAILQYGKQAAECLAKLLLQYTQHREDWIAVHEMYKEVYYLLQFHNFASWIARHGCTLESTNDITFPNRLQKLWSQSLMAEGAGAESLALKGFWKQSLVWAERGRTQAIHFQLAPNKLSTSDIQQLCEFDLMDDVVWNTIKSSRAACGPGTFVLEYYFSEDKDLQFVYVMTKEDEVFMQILNNDFTLLLRNKLENLRNFFSQGSKATGNEDLESEVNASLEWMYEMLISPIEKLLEGMEPEDKLIIVAPELLSDVPFAALRKPDSLVGEGYLIQSHTISVTPSLRILQQCSERLKEVDQDVLPDTSVGTIVAVGDPAYKEFPQSHDKATGNSKMFQMRLKGTGEEVEFIEELIGKEHVVKLMGTKATPSEVLKWAKYPSESGVKQVVFHIAAHGIGQDNKKMVKNGAIILASPPSPSQQNYDTTRQGALVKSQDDAICDYDNVETKVGGFSLENKMVDVHEEEAQTSNHGEGMRNRVLVPISKYADDTLKSENIIGCGFEWRAHMVVLSACDSAQGKIMAEGVLNLPRALMIAGVPCVVVSQWKVDGSSTCDLMKGFYQELRSGKDVSSSLRATMLQMLKAKCKVYEWAPFVVCGLPTIRLPSKLQVALEHAQNNKIGFPGSPCETDGHLKQECKMSTIGIGDTPENCFQTGLPEMKNESILTMGRKGKFERADSIEFLFKQAEDMSKVVGVGLQWSKVVVTKEFGVVVKHIGEHLWSDLWKETSLSPMRIPISKPPPKLSMCNLTPEQSSKSFGVGLVGSRLENNCMYMEDNQNQTGEMFPCIFELAEKMGLSENAKDSNFQHPSGISSEAVEGEKNDHGGPLLETMEGGGETDQGGRSSEPMDPMDVGESSQGGNSGEPVEGVESGQGGPSSGPTEVGGQRDQQSSDFQLRFESLQAKGPQDSNENKSLTVIVIPEVGGIFYEGLSNRQVQPDCWIKGAAIAPWLKFKFEILGEIRKITTTTETRCDLGGGQLTLHEDWDLGYCHDNITISLTCENRQAVQVSPGTVVAIDVMKRAMTETFTGSMSHANQIASQANVQVQMPVIPIGIQAQGTLEVIDTIADSHALAVTVETSNTQFSGFNVNQLECAGSLVFNFLYPEEIVDVKARGKRQFIHAGINKTFWPTIVGKWFPLDREEACLYKFKTDRDIHSIGNLMRFLQQKYEVLFVINHAMSHIHYYEDKKLQGPGVKSVDRVLTKLPEV